MATGFETDPIPAGLHTFSPTVDPIDMGSADSGVLSTASTLPDVSGGSGSTLGDIGNILGDLGNIGSSAVNSPLGQMGELYGLYSLISGQAKNTQTQNDQLAGQIGDIGAPLVSAGHDELSSYQAGQLTGPFQTEYQTATQQDAQQAKSQEQQLGQILAGSSGGQNMTGALASGTQQIEGQRAQADQAAMSNAFLGELNASLGLTSAGGQYVQSGITQEISSNTQLQQQLSQLMGALSEAYAQSQATRSGGASGSTAGSIGSIVSGVGSLWKDVSGLFGFNASSALSASTAAASAAGAGLMAGPEAELGAIAGQAGSDIAAGATMASPAFAGAGAGAGAAGAAEAGAAGAGAAGAAEAGTGAAGAASAAGAGSGAGAAAGGSAAASGASGSTLAAIGSVALPVAVLGGIAAGLIGDMNPSTHDEITQVSGGQTVAKTPGGNSILQQGSVGYGVGGDTSKGSATWYQMGSDGQIKQALSQPDSFQLIGAGKAIASSPVGLQPEVNEFNSIYQYAKDNGIAVSAYGNTEIGESMQIYEKYGGQQGWGVDFPTWLTNVAQVAGNVAGNLNIPKQV